MWESNRLNHESLQEDEFIVTVLKENLSDNLK